MDDRRKDSESKFARELKALRSDPQLWLRSIRAAPTQYSTALPRGMFPSDEVADYFLDPNLRLDARDLRSILRFLLPCGFEMVQSDSNIFSTSVERLAEEAAKDEWTSEYNRRVFFAGIRGKLGWNTPAPIPDLSWLVDAALRSPQAAIDVARTYIGVHALVLNDLASNGLNDFVNMVQLHVLGLPSLKGPAFLQKVAPSDLEFLVAGLYRAMGYDVRVTPRSHDGGHDVVAISSRSAEQVRILIEVKQWHRRVGVQTVRALRGVIDSRGANKGTIVAPGGFSRGPGTAETFAAEDAIIELVDGEKLSRLIVGRFGPDWRVNTHHAILEGRRTALAELPR